MGMIGKCEDHKYPNGKGYLMPRDYVFECMEMAHNLSGFDANLLPAIAEEIYVSRFDPNSLYRQRILR